ncbi:MAG: creatininase family protein [Haloechinothrix sp.]
MIHFAELSYPQVADLLHGQRVPVLLLPIGSVEPHGPHAPLCTDQVISAGMCERVAHRLRDDPEVRVLVLPPLPYGVTRFAAQFPGTVSVSADTLHALVLDVCGSLIDQGFGHLVLVNNHFEPEHVETLRRVAATVQSVHGARIGHLDLIRRHNAQRLTEEFRSGSCHAGRYETSLVLADRPDLVDTRQMRGLPALPVNMPAAMAAGRTDFMSMGMVDAYCGTPARANGEEGAATFSTLATMLTEAIRELVGER